MGKVIAIANQKGGGGKPPLPLTWPQDWLYLNTKP